MTMRMVMMGPPGAGKGTQAVRLASRFSVPTISTGEIFRTNIKAGTELGLKAEGFISVGRLVPDEITNAMVEARLSEADVQHGFVLDGYPRTLEQAAALDAILAHMGVELDVVIEIHADAEVVTARLLDRAHAEGRDDDTAEVIRERLGVYARETEPLAELYVSRGILAQVDGGADIDEVTERLVAAVEPYVAA
jgi:adenylate kinase